MLTMLLVEHNAKVRDPALRIRLRAVVHAGEIHMDNWGFYGEELDVAFRLLDSSAVKRTLSEGQMSPLVLVISEEIFRTIVRHGYLDTGQYVPLVRVRVAERQHRGWVHTPAPIRCDEPVTIRGTRIPLLSPAVAIASAREHSGAAWNCASGNAWQGPVSGRQNTLNLGSHAIARRA